MSSELFSRPKIIENCIALLIYLVLSNLREYDFKLQKCLGGRRPPLFEIAEMIFLKIETF